MFSVRQVRGLKDEKVLEKVGNTYNCQTQCGRCIFLFCGIDFAVVPAGWPSPKMDFFAFFMDLFEVGSITLFLRAN
jgi:hypothetical protein